MNVHQCYALMSTFLEIVSINVLLHFSSLSITIIYGASLCEFNIVTLIKTVSMLVLYSLTSVACFIVHCHYHCHHHWELNSP